MPTWPSTPLPCTGSCRKNVAYHPEYLQPHRCTQCRVFTGKCPRCRGTGWLRKVPVCRQCKSAGFPQFVSMVTAPTKFEIENGYTKLPDVEPAAACKPAAPALAYASDPDDGITITGATTLRISGPPVKGDGVYKVTGVTVTGEADLQKPAPKKRGRFHRKKKAP